jgi:hypothetical protein
MEGLRRRDDIHLPDGEAQRRSDEVFARNLGREEVEAGFLSRWTCPEVKVSCGVMMCRPMRRGVGRRIWKGVEGWVLVVDWERLSFHDGWLGRCGL